MNFLKKLVEVFTSTKEPLDKGEHPLLAMKRKRDAIQRQGVGVVYGADGTPRISADWARNLSVAQRAWVDKDLASRGFRMTDYFNGTFEEIK